MTQTTAGHITAAAPADPSRQGNVLVVPGAGVTHYLVPAVERLRARGVGAQLLAAPAAPGAPADLRAYGRWLAERLVAAPKPPALVVGLSFGTQAAAIALAASGLRSPLLLVSPTVDPSAGRPTRLLVRWARQGRHEPVRLLVEQTADWRRAGVRRLSRLVRSAVTVDLESALNGVRGHVYVAHAEQDVIASHAWASRLASAPGRTLLLLPGRSHSWPYGDADGFGDLVEDLLR